MFIEQPPQWVRLMYKDALWRKNEGKRIVFLTFDDGPIPDVTPWVLDTLEHYEIKATFFVVGDNVRKYPEVYQKVVQAGHKVGNHTYNHLRAWEWSTAAYIANVEQNNALVQSHLFRPPYGWLLPKQYRELKKRYNIVMWDVVTRDYSNMLNGEQVLNNIKHLTRNGSIITFHDSLKARENLYYALPKAIEWLLANNYSFGLL